jgi:hypothetical protein
MPLVKGTEQKYGADKFQVLLLSVDLGYGESVESATKGDKERMAQQSVTWPNVLLAKGFEDTQKLFHIDGYGLTLIGPDGIVRGLDLQPQMVEELLGKIYG